jgi:hypothetical protein
MWLSVIGGQAMAQSPPALPNDLSNPDRTGMLPPPYSANYGTLPESYTGMPAGYPPGANAWPNIGPYYGPPLDETSNQGGLWFNRQVMGSRKFFFTLEGLVGTTRRPANFVGDPQANTLPANLHPGVQFTDHNQQFFELPAGSSTIGTPSRSLFGTGNGGGNGNNSITDFPIFLGQSTGSITDSLSAGGLRATWGWWNADQSGLQMSGFFLGPSAQSFLLGDYRGFDEFLYNNQAPEHQTSHLHAFAGLPLGGADTDQDGLPGVVAPYDIYYRLQYETQVGGANLDWYAAPIVERSAFTIRPAYGARYMAIRESFIFDAADSGLGYTINLPTSNTNGQGGNNNNGGFDGFLSPLVLEPLVAADPMQSYLISQVTTQLAGPEAGIRFDIGRERFKVFATSKFGLMANYSSRNISGFNIGDAFYASPTGTILDPTAMPRNNPAATRFARQDTNTALSPLFEQSIFGQARIFQFVPLLKRSRILSNAEFQVGYTVIVAGNVYRPSQDIDWQAYPVNPGLRDKRGTYVTGNYSFGVQWQY